MFKVFNILLSYITIYDVYKYNTHLLNNYFIQVLVIFLYYIKYITTKYVKYRNSIMYIIPIYNIIAIFSLRFLKYNVS